MREVRSAAAVAFGAACLTIAAAIVGCAKQAEPPLAPANGSAHARLVLSAEEGAIVARVKAHPTPPGMVSQVRGADVFKNVELHYTVDQFGEKPACQFEIDGRMSDGREIQARKFLLIYYVKGKDVLLSTSSFFGPPAPLRLFIEGKDGYTQVPVGSDSDANLLLSGPFLSSFLAARAVKIFHGQGASGEIAFVYDLSRMESVGRIGQALCGGVPFDVAPGAVAAAVPEVAPQPAGTLVVDASTPAFTLGEPYSSLRAKLIASDWAPFTAADADTCGGGDTRCQGRPEMEACAGSGSAPCRFLWKKEGKTLVVLTVGEVEPVLAALETRPVEAAMLSTPSGPAAPESGRPSFDCRKASSPNEKLICSDDELARLDRELAGAYLHAKATAPDQEVFKQAARAAWHVRESSCSDKPCLLAWYAERKQKLTAVSASK